MIFEELSPLGPFVTVSCLVGRSHLFLQEALATEIVFYFMYKQIITKPQIQYTLNMPIHSRKIHWVIWFPLSMALLFSNDTDRQNDTKTKKLGKGESLRRCYHGVIMSMEERI